MLSVTTEENEYELQNGCLIASNDILNGTVTATSWVYSSEPEKIVEFKYDHNGLRTQKKVTQNGVITTTNYTLHGKMVTHMTVGADKLHFFYDAQSRPAKVNFNGTLYTYLHNLQGDIVGILDNEGQLVVEYKYDAWGCMLSNTGAMANTLGERNPFRYRGYVYDEETGLYYLRSRYYKPEWGQFISPDSLLGHVGTLGSHNLFAYCRNMPVGNKDPDGRDLALDQSDQMVGGAILFTGLYATVFCWWAGKKINAAEYSAMKRRNRTASKSISSSASAKDTDSETNDDDTNKKYNIAIAYGNSSPVPVGPAMTSDEIYKALHVVNVAATVQKYVLSSPHRNITSYVYGAYTYSSTDAYNLAKRFGDLNPRLDPREGSKRAHYNVKTPVYKNIHFWFFD